MKNDQDFSCRAEAFEEAENEIVNPAHGDGRKTVGDLITSRLSRREMLQGLGGIAIAGGIGGALPGVLAPDAEAGVTSSFSFEGIHHGVDETHHVAEGYSADILIRWGDRLFEDSPVFDPYNQSADAQEMQFGYNNDFIGFVPLGGDSRGLLCVNHEYTSKEVMFPNLIGGSSSGMTPEIVAIEQAAHGGSVVEVAKDAEGWKMVTGSPFNRRITALSTEMQITGPAAGHARLKTSGDPAGNLVIGMINNCAGGMTPWGTWLSGEENFNGYFSGGLADDHPEAANYRRYGLPGGWYGWGVHDRRFDVNAEPREGNRFGWVVEIDPLDPRSTPKKRTALGRFKHEGAANVVSPDGRVVVYMGDDQRFEYVYKFVTNGTYNPDARDANMGLLDDGTLYVARFDGEGTVTWLALTHGTGPLTPANGFASQADVVIEARRAADLVGATPMDRPEDIEANPATGRVYVMLTNNTKRKSGQVDAANPRAKNTFGHIIEIAEPEGDFTATTSRWDILVKCGNPAANTGAEWNAEIEESGWFASPDNCAIDPEGRLWVATDQGSKWRISGTADGLWALETEGTSRGAGKMFFRVPVGAEMCGPCFTLDGETLFVAVQHPGTSGTNSYPGFERASTFEDPATRWPDFKPDMPPRPSVVVITKNGGGKIGG